MTISRGKVFDYLGMELYFGTYPDTMIISMIKYLQEIIDKFPEVLRETSACPTPDKLFKVCKDEDRKLLSEEMAKHFHRKKAQLLFVCKRARPDVEMLVSFLTIMVNSPTRMTGETYDTV